jgi:CRISPR system Cascade subunit CasA
MDVLDSYFEKWHGRFDLFGAERPFYQTPLDEEGMWTTVAKLAHERASGNNAVLFDHNSDSQPTSVTAAEAARLVVTQQSLSLGGLIGIEGGRASATSAPLVGSAVLLVNGANLFETLLLNLVPYSPDQGLPQIGTYDADCPAWEQDEIVQPGETRLPKGYLDYLTWQSRRLYLRPPVDAACGVSECIVSRGREFPKDYFPRDPFMMLIRREKAPTGQNPWPAVRLREDRALWRDSHALFGSVPNQVTRPAVVDELARLAQAGALPPAKRYQVSVFGMASNQAKVFLWRHERQPLPLLYLESEALVEALRDSLRLTETVRSEALGKALWRLAEETLAPGDDREPDRGALGTLMDSYPASRLYWEALETPFRELVMDLADKPEQAGDLKRGWAETVRRQATDALRDTTSGLKTDARNLRAVTAASSLLGGKLRKIIGDFTGGG